MRDLHGRNNLHSIKTKALFLVPLFLFLPVGVAALKPTSQKPLKLVTWNTEWLTLRPLGDPLLPENVGRPSPQTFQAFRHYAKDLDGDIIALQETDSAEAIFQIFPADSYTLLQTSDSIIQKPALLLKKNIPFRKNPDLTALGINPANPAHPLRRGLDITLFPAGKTPFRLLAVHLKSGCWERRLTERKHACPILYRQLREIRRWQDERIKNHEDYVILGDFNRRFTKYDPARFLLAPSRSLKQETDGYLSPCGMGGRFIDHIFLNESLARRVYPNSLRVMTYQDDGFRSAPSDHCPVSILLKRPSG